MLWELSMVEQRYQAVREVLDTGATITDVPRREFATLSRSGLYRYFVNLVRRMPCPLVDSLYRFSTRRFGEAEDGARLGVSPGVLEVHALFVLDSQISFVGLVKRFCSNTVHSGVHVHELGHYVPPDL